MGRAKSKSKQKSATPIPFPHDGPIAYYCSYRNDGLGHPRMPTGEVDAMNATTTTATTSLRLAHWLLSETIQKADDGPKGSDVWTTRRRCVKLCQDLQGPDVITPIAVTGNELDTAISHDTLAIVQPPFTTKDQLHSLQAFKCSLLNDFKKKQTTKNVEATTRRRQQQQQQQRHRHDVADEEAQLQKDDVAAAADDDDDDEPDLVLQCGLYRLLLEWSLSSETPLPFQRAIQSNLKTIAEQHREQHHVDEVNRNVLESIWTTPECWKDSFHALEVAVNYAPLLDRIQGNREVWLGCMRFLCQSTLVVDMLEKSRSVKAGGGDDSGISLSYEELQDILRLVSILKHVLGGDPSRLVVASKNESEDRVSELLEDLQVFVSVLLASPSMLTEGFNSLGILYGRIVFLLSYDNASNDESKASQICIDTIESMQCSSLSPFARLSVVQGMAAAMDAESLTRQSGASLSLLQAYWRYTLQAGRSSTDPLVRWAAVKGLSTLAIRRKQQQSQKVHTETFLFYEKTDKKHVERGEQQQHRNVRSDDESSLVDETLDFVFDSWENPPLRKVGTAMPGLFRTLVQLMRPAEIPKIFRRVLLQPTNRKGRYVALDCLLPFLSLSSLSLNENVPILPLISLLEGIGDRGPNSVAIANLWIKILKQMWTELFTSHANASDTKDENENQVQRLFGVWLSLWVPSFCSAIVAPSMNRRKQIMAYCLPRAGEMMRDIKLLKDKIPLMLGSCLTEINRKRGASYAAISIASITPDTIADRILWAQLEIVRFASVMRVPLLHFKSKIRQCIPVETFRLALTHALPSIRMASFRAMEYLVPAYFLEDDSNLDNLRTEAGIWQQALPYSVKSGDGKEYLSSLIQTLFLFMDRVATKEAVFMEGATNTSIGLPLFQGFVIDFLIKDMIIARTIYPGTTADKEAFGIALLDCLLAYALQDDRYNGNHTIAQNGTIFIRRRRDLETFSMKKLLEALGDSEVFYVLIGLLHSIWDTTRIDAFHFLSKLVVACQVEGVALPACFSVESERQNVLARGFYLASSPRQREADTGARMLVFLYASTAGIHARQTFLMNLIDMSDERISLMRAVLNSHSVEKSSLMEDGCSLDGSAFPLAFGLIHAVRLCIQHEMTAKRLGGIHEIDIEDYMLKKIVAVCSKALQLSLLVVADVQDGEIIDGVDSVSAFNMDGLTTDSPPLNVNTGAIGANGTFSLVNGADQEEAKSRLAMQRVVVGTWLLTKETTATLATVLTLPYYKANYYLVAKVGQLLLSTLATLKHAGAAFAARDALQAIATAILIVKGQTENEVLPPEWSSRLMDEVSLQERVRNSTLRRSTGYALGFVAIMRAEVEATTNSRAICQSILMNLLRLSLPSEKRFAEAFARLGLGDKSAGTFVFAASTGSQACVLDDQYEDRSRVHALNVLRLIILDAPLASVIGPYIGDAIISAILGYSDQAWSVRNSATMVFAAAMLRVVDCDKNASNMDKTANNAISISELFRRYPPLEGFIPSVLHSCVSKMEKEGSIESQMFPILLLLSRVQPVENCGDSSIEISKRYSPLLMRCLGSKDQSIRAASARSVAVMSLSETRLDVINQLAATLQSTTSVSTSRDWNVIDGFLLALEALSSSFCKKSLLKTNGRSFFNDDTSMVSLLLSLVSNDNCPPPCRAASLRILLSLDSVSHAEILRRCKTILWDGKVGKNIGGTLLYATAAKGLCHAAEHSLWNATNAPEMNESLSHLKGLFQSDQIDVRIAAVKCFKKNLHDKLDQVVSKKSALDNTINDAQPLCLIEELSAMLLQSLAVEVDQDSSRMRVGSHTPNLRRLSRCFLKVVYANHGASTSRINTTRYNGLWSISQRMIRFDPSSIDSNGEFPLAANAVEMMAVCVAAGRNQDEGKNDLTSSQLESLLLLIEGLNDPLSSWRSRYSAALALETCNAVFSNNKDALEPLKHRALACIIQMLQDSDPDVRRVAVRAATKYYPVTNKSQSDTRMLYSASSDSFLPEWALEWLFPRAFDTSNDDTKPETINALTEIVLRNCNCLLNVMEVVLHEFGETSAVLSIKTEKLVHLVNTNTTRKIFEDEVPNPLHEALLVNQLAASSLAELTNTGSGFPPSSRIVDLLHLCTSALNCLATTLNVGGMVHDLSRFPSVFPSLHAVLCVAAVFVYSFDLKDYEPDVLESMKASTKIILRDNKYVHPEILRALEVLTMAIRGQGVDQQDWVETVGNLAFLLKKDGPAKTWRESMNENV